MTAIAVAMAVIWYTVMKTKGFGAKNHARALAFTFCFCNASGRRGRRPLPVGGKLRQKGVIWA